MFDSLIRTIVPLIVGVLLGQAARAGLHLDPGLVTQLVTAAITTGYYALARAVEHQFPAVGKWLLGLGLPVGQPVYRRVGRSRPVD